MKIRLLSLALMSTIALGACADNTDAGADMAPANTAMTDPANDGAMAPGYSDPTLASTDPMNSGGATTDIVAGASNSPDHTTLVAAVQAADLVQTLQGPGPYTVFAPSNAAFDALPAGTVDGLMQPAQKSDLSNLLTYHVVAGNVSAAALTQQIQAGNGEAMLNTVAGGQLTARANPAGGVTITDAQGNTANVTNADMMQTNGVIHVIDRVLMP